MTGHICLQAEFKQEYGRLMNNKDIPSYDISLGKPLPGLNILENYLILKAFNWDIVSAIYN